MLNVYIDALKSYFVKASLSSKIAWFCIIPSWLSGSFIERYIDNIWLHFGVSLVLFICISIGLEYLIAKDGYHINVMIDGSKDCQALIDEFAIELQHVYEDAGFNRN